MKKGKIIGASVGNCVHVAGVIHFLSLAQDEGYDTVFLGPAVRTDVLFEAIKLNSPRYVAVGYRLTAENFEKLLPEIINLNKKLEKKPLWVFGGTPPVAEIAEKSGFFDVVFDGTEDIDDCISFLRTGIYSKDTNIEHYAQDIVSRIEQKKPYPLLRHHFGLPSYEETKKGIETIAKAKVLDIISLGIDQNTQQYFFRPEMRNKDMDGAGGVPVRTKEQFEDLKKASRFGNFPLMRCYSGTDDVINFADTLHQSISNAWCAVPLCWYNEIDGRGTRKLHVSMDDAQRLMRWHGERGIPVELNEPHHWGLRDAHDVVSVAMSYISAYNAKKNSVKDYISQYMFNIPNSLTFSMDLAKVLAQVEMTESLKTNEFRVYRQVRAGLPFLSSDIDIAKGQLAASTQLSMAIEPHIIHVVGYSEGLKAASADVVIESCKIVRGVVRSVLYGNADAKQDLKVQSRKRELIIEAEYLIKFIEKLYEDKSEDPLADAAVLTDCIKKGILDAPHILKNDKYTGTLNTRVYEGKCLAYDPKERCFLNEKQRLFRLTGKEI
ncbi:MAG TPA: cobalamin B12-binding domain-containing protein [Clostridia bacterium]|nr:cobalamin B12-binding domain-containing protein [Clostridia bacterium]HXK71208.1 cobalamin B12-binding domain-containing protein [Clostridia bacterium]